MFVDAVGAERAAAGADGDLAAFEVAEELLPFLVGGLAVFLGRAQRASAGDERAVGGDGLVGVDGLVSHGDADVAVTGDDLRDVRRQPVEHGVGDEDPAEVVGGEPQWLPGGRVGRPVRARASSSRSATNVPPREWFSVPTRRWNSSGAGGSQTSSWLSRARTMGTVPSGRRMRQMMALSTSASSGLTTSSRSVSVLDGAICSSGTSSPVLGSRYWIEAVVAELESVPQPERRCDEALR